MIITKYVTRYGKQFPVSQLSKNSTIKVDVQCPSCSTIRSVMYSSIMRAGHTVCQKCSVANACEKSFRKGERHHALVFIRKADKGFSLFQCDCGNQKKIRDYSVRSGGTKSCGCLRKSSRFVTQLKGEDHPKWKGGSSSDRERFMQTSVYKAWRLDVFERDLFTCRKCGQAGGSLEAHHIESYHSNESLRTETTNGVTLCKSCHSDFHDKYGRVNFTSTDYTEWVNNQE